MAQIAGVAAGGILTIASTAYQINVSKQRAESNKNALRLRLQQEETAAKGKSIDRMRNANAVLARQIAMGASRGIAASSASFFAIRQDTLKEFEKDENADALSLSFKKVALNQQIQNQDFIAKTAKTSAIFDAAKSIANSVTAAAGAAGGAGGLLASGGGTPASISTGGAQLKSRARQRTAPSQNRLSLL